MSNLRSIAEGTFVLGDTNNLAFQAGSGIKIDSPSEGTVRIANDETVLWEETNYVYGTNSVTLSEDYRNFERILVYNSKGDINEYFPNNGQSVKQVTLTYFAASNIWLIPWTFQSDGVTFSGSSGKMWSVGTTTTFDVTNTAQSNRWIQPMKIIGVNRISGGNNE